MKHTAADMGRDERRQKLIRRILERIGILIRRQASRPIDAPPRGMKPHAGAH